MESLAFVVLVCFVAFFVYICIRTFIPKQQGDSFLLWPVLGVAIIAVCIIPLIVYICKGGFAGMTVGESIYHIVDMVFSGEAGMASNLITGICGWGFLAFVFHVANYIDSNRKR